ALGAGHDPISDTYVSGDGEVELPGRGRRLVLAGEGAFAPVRDGAARESVGMDPGSTLPSLGPRTFAAHGGVLHVRNRTSLSPRALDSLPAAHVLREATSMRLHWPAPAERSTLVLRVAPTGPDAGPAADGVRWATADARLDDLRAIVG